MISGTFTAGTLWLGLAWALYLGVHSLLAANPVKARIAGRWPGLGRRYRLVYNAIATALIAPLIVATERLDTAPLWSWHGPWAWASGVVGALALGGIAWSSRAYDLGEFLGLGARRPSSVLGLSAVHRFVRHPWYFLGLVWLWTRDMDGARLTAAAVITVYVVIGSYLEDRKLEQLHGDAYRRYRRQVPGLVPLPWRYLSRGDYERLREAGSGSAAT